MGNSLHVENGAATVEFSSPPHNALTKAGLLDLAEKIESAGADSQIRVIVIKAAGDRTFCAGADFNELVSVHDIDESVAFFDGFATLFNSMIRCSKIIIARIQGKAVGGALGIIAAADLSYATQHGAIKLSELNVGIGPFVVGPVIEHKIGKGNLSKLTFSPNQFFPPDWALQNGLYAGVFETIEKLDDEIEKKTIELCSYNPAALTQIKSVLRPDLTQFEALLTTRKKMSAELLLSDFTQNRLKELTKKN